MAGTLALGIFDGVHIGHLALLQAARAAGGPLTVVSFTPHPQEVLTPPYPLLTLEEEREKLLLQLADRVVFLPFNEIRHLSAADYLAYLIKEFNPHTICAGYNHTFGKNAAGDARLLLSMAAKWGVKALIFPPYVWNNAPVSSTGIKAALQSGKPEQAAQLLGRQYTLQGTVVEGQGRGHKLGFPTANLSYSSRKLTPLEGVYATLTTLNGQTLQGVTNIGHNPTFPGATFGCETFLLNETGNFYNQPMTLAFCKYLRAEKAFSGAEALSRQIEQDVALTRLYFANQKKRGVTGH